MRLFIAEKPELARAIARGLGHGIKSETHITCGDDIVTWCIGHLLELQAPAQYDAKYKNWSLSALPFFYYPVKFNLKKNTESHAKSVIRLIKNADVVVHAGDPDREGQIIVDQLLEYANYKGPVLRFLTNDNDVDVVRKNLSLMKPNNEFNGLSNAGYARQIADQLYGFNMTMALSSMFESQGGKGRITVGRVQTPVLNLIVQRTLANQNHTASFFYTISGKNDDGLKFTVVAPEVFDTNKKGHFLNKNEARQCFNEIKGQSVVVDDVIHTQKKQNAPLLYNMINLQIDCAKKFDFKPDKVSGITQSLREKYGLITYNGTDCCYLNDVHHDQAPDVFNAVFQHFPELANYGHDFSIKGKCFNDSKVTAHHGIIPTGKKNAQIEKLSKDELAVYDLICQRYLVQFFPPALFTQSELFFSIGEYKGQAKSKFYQSLSFLNLANPKAQTVDLSGEPIDLMKGLKKGDSFDISFTLNESKTKPLPYYNYATLLKDLTQVAKYIKHPKLRELLIEKDKGVDGENGGIGTPRTRDLLVKNLIDSDMVVVKKKNILASDQGIKFIGQLPADVVNPDMTALWHEQLQMVEKGEMDIKSFLDYVFSFISTQINNFKKDGFKFNIKRHNCPKCQSFINQFYSKKSKKHFWACTQSECDFICDDEKGLPVFK